jgi:hypothetical protein
MNGPLRLLELSHELTNQTFRWEIYAAPLPTSTTLVGPPVYCRILSICQQTVNMVAGFVKPVQMVTLSKRRACKKHRRQKDLTSIARISLRLDCINVQET